MNHSANSLLTDTNLARMCFSDDGRTLTIDFLNMVDGRPSAQLAAAGVVALNYHNTFSEDDALPTYVGEVTCRELQEEELESNLLRLSYSFLAQGVNTFVPKSRCFHIHIEGGELAVDLICTEYRLSRQKM